MTMNTRVIEFVTFLSPIVGYPRKLTGPQKGHEKAELPGASHTVGSIGSMGRTVYLPTIWLKFMVNVGRYTLLYGQSFSYWIEVMGLEHWWYTGDDSHGKRCKDVNV